MQQAIPFPPQTPAATLQCGRIAAVSWILLIVWLAGSAAAFWHLELGNWRPFVAADVRPFGSADAALAEQWFRTAVGPPSQAGPAPRITFVHLYNPQCRCNGFTEPHLQRLMERYGSHGVRFVAAAGPKSTGSVRAPLGLPLMSSTDGMLSAAGIKTAPAALMFDADGRLIYYGPYSDSAWCGSGAAVVDRALERALSGAQAMTGIPASRGCFCEW